jgi:uncharacterized protein
MKAILAAVLVACNAAGASAQQNNDVPQVSGSGSVEVLARPASAVILVSLTGDGLDGPTAASSLHTLVAKVTEALKGKTERVVPYGAGYGENANMRRNYPNEPGVRTTRDYLARAGIAVEVRDPNSVPQLLNLLVGAGVDGVQGVMYVADDNDPNVQQAITRATEIALANARRTATAAGGELGPLIRIGPQGPFGFPGTLARFQGYSGQASVPLHVSDVMARVTVQGTWEFRPRR